MIRCERVETRAVGGLGSRIARIGGQALEAVVDAWPEFVQLLSGTWINIPVRRSDDAFFGQRHYGKSQLQIRCQYAHIYFEVVGERPHHLPTERFLASQNF